jgi:hypothetical protein
MIQQVIFSQTARINLDNLQWWAHFCQTKNLMKNGIIAMTCAEALDVIERQFKYAATILWESATLGWQAWAAPANSAEAGSLTTVPLFASFADT